VILEALDRTIRLMRDESLGDLTSEVLLDALTSTIAVLVADEATLQRHSARVALAALAQLAARSGTRVYVVAPETDLNSPLPPLRGARFLAALVEIGCDLLPGVAIRIGTPPQADVAVVFGGSAWSGPGDITVRVSASNWNAQLACSGPVHVWNAHDWPLGGLAAAVLAASEVFKASVRKLTDVARNPAWVAELFAPAQRAHLRLADDRLVGVRDLGAFDLVSGGAITQSVLYALAQIPGVLGEVRVIEPEQSELSNLNRYMLLRRSRLGLPKALDLSCQELGGLRLIPAIERFGPDSGPLREQVLVGVDDIPSRWAVQARWPAWLGVGATSHYCALVSHHAGNLPCAGCLHPRDEPADGPIPSAAFVSFWSGLLLASRFVRHRSVDRLAPGRQQEYLAALRPEGGPWASPVARRSDCPVTCCVRERHVA
jgi:hypothetical protein